MNNHTEFGYVLLSMLVMLLSVSAGWLSIASTAAQYGATPNAISERDRRGLADARQSMLSYAVLYPYFYGPTGAGPAHLPCPDTDGYRESDAEVQSAENQRRDGPNPPCADHAGSDGQLPRHIALPGYRYLFHSQSTQRYDYTVAGFMVNNPLNRVVNLDRLYAHADQPVATIRLASSINKKSKASVSITGMALVNATAASVADWVVKRSARVRYESCRLQSNDVVAKQPILETKVCHSPGSLSQQCVSDQLLISVLDLPAVFSGDCLATSLELNTLDGVPALRHWFVRNEWYRSFTLTRQDECAEEESLRLSCELSFSFDSLKAAIDDRRPIELSWIRSS